MCSVLSPIFCVSLISIDDCVSGIEDGVTGNSWVTGHKHGQWSVTCHLKVTVQPKKNACIISSKNSQCVLPQMREIEIGGEGPPRVIYYA